MTVEQQQSIARTGASIDEIKIWLRDRLRNKWFYDRLRSIHVRPNESQACGWAASVRGEFTHVEQDECRAAIVELQRHLSLRNGSSQGATFIDDDADVGGSSLGKSSG
jgi:hypothetical protein